MNYQILLALLKATSPGDGLIYAYDGQTCETTINYANHEPSDHRRMRLGRTMSINRIPGVTCETAWFVVTRDLAVHTIEACEDRPDFQLEVTFR